ncbi:MAG: divalent-cation tolerance protein CutA [Luteolibacter sp.]
MLDAVQPGHEFLDEAGFHGKVASGRISVFRGGMENVRLVLCSFPDLDSARQIGTLLVERQLAACVNLLPGAESVYRWQGKVESAQEVLALFKTTEALLPEFEKTLSGLHRYEVPEIIAIEPSAVSASYRDWLRESLAPNSD